ncbi:MAG TPA: hypothetical protein VGE39_10795 [Prosthecobacter sp.]
MSDPVQLPPPPVSLIEEWDNPAMAEFKRQEAEDRAAFGCSEEAREWLRRLQEGESRWSWNVTLAKKIPIYDKPPIRLKKRNHDAVL